MKQLIKLGILLILLVVGTPAALAQYGFGTNSPKASAAFDVSSNIMGFLPPRMNATQMKAIKDPKEGLIVYNTTERCLAYYSKNMFSCFSNPPVGLPVASNVSLSVSVNNDLIASYTYSQPDNLAQDNTKTTYKWYIASDASGTGATVTETTDRYYKGNALYYGQYVAVGVTPVTSYGQIKGAEVQSTYVPVFHNTPPSATLSITSADDKLTAVSNNYVQEDQFSENWNTRDIYNWYYSDDPAGTINVVTLDNTTNECVYIPPSAIGKYITVSHTPVTVYGVAGNKQSATIPVPFITGTHKIVDKAPVDCNINYKFVSIAGKWWITKNLGASQYVANNGDQSDLARGWYYRFNNQTGMAAPSVGIAPSNWVSSSISVDNNGWSYYYDPCYLSFGVGWSVPAYTSWSSLGADANKLQLPAAGYLKQNGGTLVLDNSGYYWTTKIVQDGVYTQGWSVYVTPSLTYHKDNKNNQYSIRCIK